MQYRPLDLEGEVVEVDTPLTLVSGVTKTTIVRNVLVKRFQVGTPSAWLDVGLEKSIQLRSTSTMRIGGENVAMGDYLTRVVEPGDLLDFLMEPGKGIVKFWIHIEYLDKPTGNSFSRKEDALFAMRAKSGEKAERIVAQGLQTHGHRFPSDQLQGTGTFQIRYAGKKRRQPDLICERCGLKTEVKKRNRDTRFRVSHSAGRPFQSENQTKDLHAFVFPDMSVHYVPNQVIIEEITAGRVQIGSDEHDSWAELDRTRVLEGAPPPCQAA